MAEVEISQGSSRGSGWRVVLIDFANMLKAFIGSNYLTIAFAFKQSGMALGLIGLFFVATLTAHCCNLIVKCKYHAIRLLIQRQEINSSSCSKRRYTQNCDSGRLYTSEEPISSLSSINSDDADVLKTDSDKVKKALDKFSYGHIGKVCFGKIGLAVVNISIIVTQFGFCVGYHIFLGNTILSMFPLYNCSIPVTSQVVTPSVNGGEHCSVVNEVNSLHTEKVHVFNMTGGGYGVMNSLQPSASFSATSAVAFDPTITNVTMQFPVNTTVLPYNTSTTGIPFSNLTIWKLVRSSDVPDLKYLVMMPAAIFIFTSLVRHIRQLGCISFFANFSIFLGCASVLGFLISGFTVSDKFAWVNFKDMPIFFGLVTSSFEGIGTMLPIEASMVGNRHNFTKYLYGAVAMLSSILTAFAILGYLRYGDGIQQMLNANIPSSGGLTIGLNVCLCVGVLLTFPLMLFPVVELAELYLFGKDKSQILNEDAEQGDDEQVSLLSGKESDSLIPESKEVPKSVPAWKRNCLRISIVLAAAGLAVLLRNYFAYISAFVGALGSTVLAYILPCLFHLRLCWSDLSLPIKIKDIAIIFIGVIWAVAGVYSVLNKIISDFN